MSEHEGPSETDGARLAGTKAPSETDGAPSERRHPRKYKMRLLGWGHLRKMVRSHTDDPHEGPSETNGAPLEETKALSVTDGGVLGKAPS